MGSHFLGFPDGESFPGVAAAIQERQAGWVLGESCGAVGMECGEGIGDVLPLDVDGIGGHRG